MKKLYVVVPCYNEEETLVDSTYKLTQKLNSLISDKKITEDSRIYYIDDGSKDSTWALIEKLHNENSFVNGIKLSKNRGHQNALLAGLMNVKNECDCCITIDADLQDDINSFDEMIEKFEQGYEIVYGVRNDRKSDTAFKRGTAQLYYKILSFFGAEIVYNHADYRLMSSRALDALESFKEVNLFLRGLIPLIGFNSCTVEYSRKERLYGETKYSLKKMVALALDGITSFSVKPIRMITVTGFFSLLLGLGMLIYSLVQWKLGNTIRGWTSLIWSIWTVGGLELLALGIIGEYIAKIYLETKARPRFIIEKVLDDKGEDGKKCK